MEENIKPIESKVDARAVLISHERDMILRKLNAGKLTISEIAQSIGRKNKAVDYHLRKLRAAKLIDGTAIEGAKSGKGGKYKRLFYSITDAGKIALLEKGSPI